MVIEPGFRRAAAILLTHQSAYGACNRTSTVIVETRFVVLKMQ
jgi:hypothetical protein